MPCGFSLWNWNCPCHDPRGFYLLSLVLLIIRGILSIEFFNILPVRREMLHIVAIKLPLCRLLQFRGREFCFCTPEVEVADEGSLLDGWCWIGG